MLARVRLMKIVGGWAKSKTLLDGFPDKIKAQLGNGKAPTKKPQKKNERAVQKKKRRRDAMVEENFFYYLEASLASLKLKTGIVYKAIDFSLH